MPRYFFHIIDRNHLVPDEEGLQLEDDAAAIKEARDGAYDMLRDALLTGDNIEHQSIEVAEAGGEVVAHVELRDLVRRPNSLPS